MFNKLSDMEKAMRSILIQIKDSNNCHSIFNNLSTDNANALYECVNRKYINNIDAYADAFGNYHFASLGNTHINADGLKFIRDMSPAFRFKNAVFALLKGTWGYLLGVITPLTVQFLIWIAKNQPEISEFLHHIINR